MSHLGPTWSIRGAKTTNRKNGKKEGSGVYTYASGGRLEAKWQEGQIHGQGLLVTANGDTYKGHLKAGKQKWKGTFDAHSSKHGELNAQIDACH